MMFYAGASAESSCPGQYRFAVASGVPLVNVKRIHDEAHPTLPRFGTDRGSQLYHLVEA